MRGYFDWFSSSNENDNEDPELRSTLSEANRAIDDYNTLSDRVDRLLVELDRSHPSLAARLRSERAESQGWFERYVKPAYEEVRAFFGFDQGMGLLPLMIPAGTALVLKTGLAAGAAIYGLTILKNYLDEAKAKERLILDDPEIPKSTKIKLITGESSSLVYAVGGGALALTIVSYMIFKKGSAR